MRVLAGIGVLGILAVVTAQGAAQTPDPALEHARDAQDRAALDRFVSEISSEAQKKPGDARTQYRYALAASYSAEVAIETGDKARARSVAESGIQAAEKAVALEPQAADAHRVLGTLCAQSITSNPLSALKYGRCAQEEINKAVELDPKGALNYVGRGVGNYYLPAAMGGGADAAIKDLRKAIALDARLAEAHLWLGIVLRKAGQHAEARQELQKAVDLAPARVWAKQQLAKTPAQ